MQRTALVTAIATLAMVGGACGAESAGESTLPEQTTTTQADPTTTSTEAVTTTTTIPAEPTPLRDVEGGTKSGIGWLAEPGLYVAYVDGKTLTLDLPEPFTYIPRRSDLILAPAGISPGIRIISLALTGIEGVVPAAQAGVPPKESTIAEITRPAPEVLSDWFDSVSQMTTSSPSATEGAGWVGQSWDVIIDPSAGETFFCAYGACVGSLVPENADVYVMGDEFGFRIWQFGGAGEGL